MKTIALFLCICVLVSCSQSGPSGESESFSDFLGYGAYDVGFRSIYAIDLSRADVPFSDWDGKLYSDNLNLKGRAVPLHIWYPGKAFGQALPFEHFAMLINRKSAGQKPEALRELSIQSLIDQANALKGADDLTEKDLQKLFQLQTNSYLNIEPVEGKFPLIIFPNGTSPANQSAMCEYLASHGYVVVGMALKGRYAHVVDASVRGLEVAVDDLAFGLEQLLTLPNVDSDQIALIGNAISSSFCAALASRNQKIKALVSLEGGFLSRFEQNILEETVFYEPQSMSLPILAIYAPHPSISPEYIYPLRYSERYFAHFPKMTEFHFLNFGLFDEYVPGIIGEAKGSTKEGFQVASELILSFLNAKVKNQAEGLAQMYSESSYESVIDTLFKLEGLVPPPNLAVLKDLFLNQGFEAIESVFNSHVEQGDQQPFSKQFFHDVRDWLAWKKDPDYIHRARLYELAVTSYPESSLHHYYLAHYLKRTGKDQAAISYFQKTLELLPGDKEIDTARKKEMRKRIHQNLGS